MKVELYDIISKIIPGGLVYAPILYYDLLPNADSISSEVVALIIMYVLGFLVDAIGYFIQRPLYWTFGGLPSQKLLSGGSFSKISIHNLDVLNVYIERTYPQKDIADKNWLFNTINTIVRAKESKRIQSFYEGYIAARNILVASILVLIIVLVKQFNWLVLGIGVSVLLLIWYRTKTKNYHFVQLLINTFIARKILDEEKKD